MKFTLHPLRWWSSPTEPIETFSALCLYWLAAILALPGDTFAAYQVYGAMAALADEEKWAIIFFIVASLQSWSVCGNADACRYPAASMSFVLWTFVAISYWFAMLYDLSGGLPVTPGLIALIALSQAWVVLRGPLHHGTK